MKVARGWSVTALAVFLSSAVEASAQPEQPSPVAVDGGAEESFSPVIWPLKPKFDQSPGWSIGIDGYAGLAVLSTSDGGFSHGLVGGLSRFQLGYFQLGGFIETTDGGDNHWRAIGGFAGAFIPYRHWVDFEFAAGLAARTYRDESARYGPDGFEATSPALVLRGGFSDRAVDDLFGVRLGGHIQAMVDLDRSKRPWAYTVETTEGDVRTVTGRTGVGGFSVGIALTVGFDVGKKPPGPAEPPVLRASR